VDEGVDEKLDVVGVVGVVFQKRARQVRQLAPLAQLEPQLAHHARHPRACLVEAGSFELGRGQLFGLGQVAAPGVEPYRPPKGAGRVAGLGGELGGHRARLFGADLARHVTALGEAGFGLSEKVLNGVFAEELDKPLSQACRVAGELFQLAVGGLELLDQGTRPLFALA
jgi:hypothetical protein